MKINCKDLSCLVIVVCKKQIITVAKQLLSTTASRSTRSISRWDCKLLDCNIKQPRRSLDFPGNDMWAKLAVA